MFRTIRIALPLLILHGFALAQPMETRTIFLDERFEGPPDLTDDPRSARPDQWISASDNGTDQWVWAQGPDACRGEGYMYLAPITQGNCPGATLQSPELILPKCLTKLQINYTRRFTSAYKTGDVRLFMEDLETGTLTPVVFTSVETKAVGDCQEVEGVIDDFPLEFRLWLQGPEDCSGLVIDNLVVKAPVIRAQIIAPEVPRINVAVGQSVSFLGMSESEVGNIEMGWAVRELKADGAPELIPGDAITYTFERKGYYEVILIATDRCSVDITPPKVEVWVTDVVVKITEPAVSDRRTPYVVDHEGDTLYFAGEVQDPGGKIKETRWLLGEEVVCTDAKTAAKFLPSCSITFPRKGKIGVVLQTLDAEGAVLGEVTQVVCVEPPLKAIVSSPPQGAQVMSGQVLELRASKGGVHANEDDTRTFWRFEGREYEATEADVMPSGHGERHAEFMVVNKRLGLVDQVIVPLYVEDPDHQPEPGILRPRDDWTLPPGGELFFEASFKDAPPDQRFIYWEIVNEDNEEVLATGDSAVLGKVTFAELGTYTASLYFRGGEQERLVSQRTIWVRTAEAGGNTPGDPTAIGSGRHNNLDLTNPHYYKINVPGEGHDISVNVDFPDGATLVFYPVEGDEEQRREVPIEGKKTLTLRGLEPGDYTWGVEPPAGVAKGKRASFSFGISVLTPSLYFSDIAENKTYNTEVGMVNPTGETAEITVLGYDNAGNILCQVSQEIPPMGNYRDTAANIFGDFAEDVTWARVDSTHELVGFSRTVSIDEMESYAVSGAKILNAELYVPHIAETTNTWYTQARVVNGQDSTIAASMVTRAQTETLSNADSFSKDDIDFLTKLGTIDEDNNWATFQDDNGTASLAGNEIFGTIDGTSQIVGLALAGSIADNPNFTSGSNMLYFTHITNSSDFWTGLALVNRGDEEQGVQINVYGDGGALTGSDTLILSANEKLVDTAANILAMANISTTDVAWLEIDADANITGYELFGTITGGNRLAGIEAITEVNTNLCMPFVDNTGALWHGIAVVNTSGSEENAVTFTLRADDGTAVDCVEGETLNPKEKQIFTIAGLFGEIPRNATWLEISGDQPLVGFEIFGNSANEHMSGLIAQ